MTLAQCGKTLDSEFEHLSRWERVVVVTDVDWIRLAVNVFRFLVPGEIRVFGTSQASEARSWIAAESSSVKVLS